MGEWNQYLYVRKSRKGLKPEDRKTNEGIKKHKHWYSIHKVERFDGGENCSDAKVASVFVGPLSKTHYC